MLLTLLCLPLLYLIYRVGFGIPYLATVSESIEHFSQKLLGFSLLGSFPNDPVKYISDLTGNTALILLLLVMSLPYLNRWFKIRLIQKRRIIGITTFFYAFLHMLLYLILDHQGNLFKLFEQALDKYFIFLGFSAFIILLWMFVTSFHFYYRKGHKLVYLALMMAALHSLLSHKFPTPYSVLFFALALLISLNYLRKRFLVH